MRIEGAWGLGRVGAWEAVDAWRLWTLGMPGRLGALDAWDALDAGEAWEAKTLGRLGAVGAGRTLNNDH
jgi:hypothetical protein